MRMPFDPEQFSDPNEAARAFLRYNWQMLETITAEQKALRAFMEGIWQRLQTVEGVMLAPPVGVRRAGVATHRTLAKAKAAMDRLGAQAIEALVDRVFGPPSPTGRAR